jgi:hypothetical protein
MTVSSSIAFLAVSRIVDQTTLAQRLDKGTSEAEKKAIHTSLSSLLERAAHLKTPGWRDLRQCSGAFDGCVYALADPHGAFAVSVGVRGGLYPYPARVTWELLKKLSEAVQQQELNIHEAKAGMLSVPLKKPMQDIMKNYSEPGDQDAVTQVQQKVDGVKSLMQENVRKILETHTTLSALEDKSAEMNNSAVKFVQQSASLKRSMQIRSLKVKVAMLLTVAALGTYALMPVWSS